MRTLKFFILQFLFLGSIVNAQEDTHQDDPYRAKLAMTSPGDYIVLGAYDNYNQADRYNSDVNEDGIETKVGYSTKYNLFYVYYNGDLDQENNVKQVQKLRSTENYHDAWLYRLSDKEAIDNKEVSENLGGIASTEPQLIVEEEELRNEDEVTDEEIHISEVTDESLERWDEKRYKEYKLFLEVKDKNTGEPINGIVEAIDPRIHRLLHNLKSNKVQYLGINKRTSQAVEFETDVFGYRRKLLYVDLANPVNENTSDVIEQIGDSIIVKFELEPHEEGDRFTMYKVFFHRDAAIMKPDSRYELDQLLKLLRSNENYHIRLIGHTNGNGMGKIIKPIEGSKDFFSIQTGAESFGSAKKLSRERAETIKKWLIMKGIEENRMEIDGAGGKFTLYEEDDLVHAIKNVRVEVEILKH
ncbi:MAG: OmpA family protein [Bacteroidota bacterium]